MFSYMLHCLGLFQKNPYYEWKTCNAHGVLKKEQVEIQEKKKKGSGISRGVQQRLMQTHVMWKFRVLART